MLNIKAKQIAGRGIGRTIGFPTINCIVDKVDGLEIGLFAGKIFCEYYWYASDAICNISKHGKDHLYIETHIWDCLSEDFKPGTDLNISLFYKLRDYKRITPANREKCIAQDKLLAEKFFATESKCYSCKFSMTEDYGYSNYTVEGSEYSCLKGRYCKEKNESIMRCYTECGDYQKGDPWYLDVERENDSPSKEWLLENECKPLD